jgi:UrcA family protein
MKVLVLAAMLVCGAAQAADFGDPPQVLVRYDDLNVDNSTGPIVLLGRISRAAEMVCHQFDSRELPRQRLHATCMDTAIADAFESISDQNLRSHLRSAYTAQKKAGRAG